MKMAECLYSVHCVAVKRFLCSSEKKNALNLVLQDMKVSGTTSLLTNNSTMGGCQRRRSDGRLVVLFVNNTSVFLVTGKGIIEIIFQTCMEVHMEDPSNK